MKKHFLFLVLLKKLTKFYLKTFKSFCSKVLTTTFVNEKQTQEVGSFNATKIHIFQT